MSSVKCRPFYFGLNVLRLLKWTPNVYLCPKHELDIVDGMQIGWYTIKIYNTLAILEILSIKPIAAQYECHTHYTTNHDHDVEIGRIWMCNPYSKLNFWSMVACLGNVVWWTLVMKLFGTNEECFRVGDLLTLLGPKHTVCHKGGDHFKCIFLSENIGILIQM